MATAHTRFQASAAIAGNSGIQQRPGIFARLLASMMEARQRRADSEIAELLARRGGIMTDELEREISRTLYGSRSFHT